MDNIELIKLAHQGDKEARDSLVFENTGLIWSIVRRFGGRGYELDDLFQIGCIGILKAIDKFDMSYDVKFSTYAVPMILGEIKRFIRDDGMVKVSRGIKENGWRIRNAEAELVSILGREPTIEEIASKVEYIKQTIAEVEAKKAEIDAFKETLLDLCLQHGVTSIAGDGWSATVRQGYTSQRVDSKKLQSQHPDIYEQVLTTTNNKPSITIKVK